MLFSWTNMSTLVNIIMSILEVLYVYKHIQHNYSLEIDKFDVFIIRMLGNKHQKH